MVQFPIKGVKWFRDIINDPSRQYGVEVHKHFPYLEEALMPYGKGTDYIRLPDQQRLVEELAYYIGSFENTKKFPEAYVASIENATVVGNSGMIITPDGYLIAETASLTGFGDGRSFTIDHLKNEQFKPPHKGHINGRLLSCATPNYGYGHQLIESFFSLLWFNDYDIDFIHMIEGENANRMSEFLNDFGISSDSFLISKAVETVSADVVSFFAPSQVSLFRPETIQMVHDTLVIPRLTSDKKPQKKVYFQISTKTVGGHLRKVGNIDELETFLLEQGFEFLDPATLTLPEKIDYLQDVDEVIVLHGSSVVNTIFTTNKNLKLITFSLPQLLVQRNITGTNIPAPHYSRHAISAVYPELCFNDGFLKTIMQIDRNSYWENQFFGQFFVRNTQEYQGPHSIEIDIPKFKDFYKLYSKVVTERE